MNQKGRMGRATNADIAGKAGEFPWSVRLSQAHSMPPSGSSKAAPRQGEVPYSPEAERSVLGGVLLEAERAWKVGVDRILIPDDFFLPEHQAIYRAALSLKGRAITSVTVAAQLSAMGVIDDVDRWLGPPWTEPYLVSLMDDYLAPLWLETHAQIIKDYSERRAMLQQAQRLAKAAFEPREDWKDLPQYRDEV